jgi:PhzF family phenazine biosynthesis protein
MGIPLFLVDAFTAEPFAGNPAAVCLLDRPADAGWMQQVAAEMNLSETAFLVPRGGDYDLRWFTPAVEVDLCGHATLAGAHVLWETGRLRPDAAARFHTNSGLLAAARTPRGIALDFPAQPARPCDEGVELAEALGVVPRFVGHNGTDYLVEVASEAEVRALRPDFALLAKLPPVRGVIVTGRADGPEYDFVSRFFAPAAGVPEDPVTGSAHCCLGPYWAGRLGKQELLGYQASRRGGAVGVRVRGDRVDLLGAAVTVLRGELAAGPAGNGP